VKGAVVAGCAVVGLDIRPLTRDDVPAALANMSRFFLMPPPSEARIQASLQSWEIDRFLGAFDGGRLVAQAGMRTFRTTVPGARTMPTAGLTAVGVVPSHTRRGLLTALLRELFADAARRGEPLSSLRASEATIYGRFGYGVAGRAAHYRIATAHAAYARPFVDAGHLELLEPHEVAGVLPAIYDRFGRSHVGAIDRPAGLWRFYLADFEAPVMKPARWVAIHRAGNGEADGYVDYQVVVPEPDGADGRVVEIGDLVAASPTTYAALWRGVLGQDLVGTVQAVRRPLDEPLRHLLGDARRLRTLDVDDEQWVRLLDVGAALAGRAYGSAGRVALAVSDPFLPGNSGTYLVDGEAGPGTGASREDVAPDLSLDVDALGAAFLGGTSFAELAAAGRVEERRPGAIALADQLFAIRPLPWCGSFF
jgi:predicted acetyltransferase